MQVVNEKQHVAVVEKYRGSSHKRIASKLEIPKGTVDDWFRTRGVLSPYYKEFAEEMNEKHTQSIMARLKIKEVELLWLRRKMFDKLKDAVVGKSFKATTMDMHRLWKMDRIERGLPTNIYSRICPCCKRERLTRRFR